MATTNWRVSVGLLALTVGGCGDDAGGGPGTTGDSTSLSAGPSSGSASSDQSPSSGPTQGPGSSSGGDETQGSAETTAGDTSDTTTGDTDGPTTSVCPEPPFADAPFDGDMISVAPVENTQLSLHPGGLVEGPVWIDGALYLSNFGTGPTPPASILRYTPGGSLEEHIAGAGSNGLAVDASGQIVAATHDDGGLSRFALDGTRTVIIDQYEGSRLNSPNDLALRSDGTIYFTDPDWQAPNPDPQPVHGVYRVDTGGTVSLEDGAVNLPNGIALSPDETSLYVGHPGGVVRYAVGDDGALGPSEPFASALGLNGVDGMARDCAGNLYITLHSQGQIRVVAPDGSGLGTIMVAPSVTNAAFGGPQGRTLYVTAGDPANGNALYSVELEIPGYPY